MHIRLDYLRIHFLLEKLSAEWGNESKQKLVDVAQGILDMVLFVTSTTMATGESGGNMLHTFLDLLEVRSG